MSVFVVSLLILISSIVFGGKQIDPPPYITSETAIHEPQASGLAQDTQSLPEAKEENSTFSSVEEGENETNNSESVNHSGSVQGESTEPSTEKTPAYNVSSEKEMPADLPQNAINNSPPLEEVVLITPTPTLAPAELPRPVMPTVSPGCGCGSGNGKAESICVCEI